MTIPPVWAVDIADDYDATTLRAPWGQRINDSMADLGAPPQTYQPTVAGGVVPDDNARFTGRWKRWGDVVFIEQNWQITSADAVSANPVTTSLPFDVSAVGIRRMSGAGIAKDSAGTAQRHLFETRMSGSTVEFRSMPSTADRALWGTEIDGVVPTDVSLQMWVLLNETVSATGGTFDNDLASTYTPGAGAPSEAYHEKINVNMAMPGTFTESTAQFVSAATSPSPTSLTVTSPVRRYARLGELGFFQFEWSGPVSGSSTGGETWLVDLPSGWTLADSGVQWLGWVYADASVASTKQVMGFCAFDPGVTDGSNVAVWAGARATGSSSARSLQVRDDAAGDWSASDAVVRSGLLVCRLT